MTQGDVAHQLQVQEAFKGLAALLDPDLKLPPDSRHPKRRKEVAKSNDQGESPGQIQVTKVINLLAQLVLRHERDLQLLHKTDTFMMFCNKEPTGILQILIRETQVWKQQLETTPLAAKPLRQHLFQAMLQDMLNRLDKLNKCPQGDPILAALIKSGMMLEDGSWPFLQWCQKTRQLVKNSKAPVSMQKMHQHLNELLDMARDPSLVLKFQSLAQGTETPVIPWRLQLSLRHNATWDLMCQLTHNSIWVLIGASLKPHTQGQSSLATDLQHLTQTRSKPKGKGKGKNHLQPKS